MSILFELFNLQTGSIPISLGMNLDTASNQATNRGQSSGGCVTITWAPASTCTMSCPAPLNGKTTQDKRLHLSSQPG